jgi:hypothetical protein
MEAPEDKGRSLTNYNSKIPFVGYFKLQRKDEVMNLSNGDFPRRRRSWRRRRDMVGTE